MPDDQIIKKTKILDDIAEILFGFHHHANLTRAHSSAEIVSKRMHLLVNSPYWKHLRPQPIEKQITKKVYQPILGEWESLQSLYDYIEKKIQVLCSSAALNVLNSADARKRGSSKSKTLGILQENQNQVERYLTVLRGLFNDSPEQATTFPNPFRKSRDLSGNDGTRFGIATYPYKGKQYSLRLIVAAIWQAASEENSKKRTHTLGNLSQEEAILTSKENFISVLAECLRAYNQDNRPDSFGSPDNPSCDLGAVERLLLRGAPFNKIFLPSESEDQQDKLIRIQHSVDHYLIDKLENFFTESDKVLMFRVLSNRVLMDEPDVISDASYRDIFKRYQDSLTQNSKEPETLYDYLSEKIAGFPWQTRSISDNSLQTLLFELLKIRIDLFTAIELDDPNGLMNVENKNSLQRLLMLGSHCLAKDMWEDIYQNLNEAKEFEQDRITLKALEELIDSEYCRCALAPGLLNTKKTQQRLNNLFSKYEEISSQFTTGRGTNIKEQIDKLSQDKLKNEFAQERTHDTRHIIHYTLTSIDNRLQRLDKKCIAVTPELINNLYQTSFKTLWNDPLSAQEEPILSIAPRGIRLNQEQYQQLDEKQKKQLAWSLYIANLAACFDQNGHVDRQKDILRGIAAMLGRTLNSTELAAETFQQEPNFSGEDIEDVIWLACSIIRELGISTEQKEIAWSFLENTCKSIDIFSRHILFEELMEGLKDFIKNLDENIWSGLPDLFTNLEEAQIRLNSDWCKYANPLYELPDLRGLVLLSLIRFMSALKLEKLHLANKQCFTLWCKVFKGNDAGFTSDEKRAFEILTKEDKSRKCTANGLGEFLQEVIQLINQNEKFHASFAEGIICNMTRIQAEQLVNIVACFTKRPIFCPRLSSSLPGKIVLTVLTNLKDGKSDAIAHRGFFSIEQYYDMLEKKSFGQYQNAHIIIPGGAFDHKKILEEQKVKYTQISSRYITSDDSQSLGSALLKVDRYVHSTYSNVPVSTSTLFSESSGSHTSEKEPGRERELRPG